jgi:lia operon protein LiaF
MLKNRKTDTINWILLIGGIFVLLEMIFFNEGILFSLLLSMGLIYAGRKHLPRKTGKILLWVGLLFLLITLLNMVTFKFLLLGILIYLLIQLILSKQRPIHIQPDVVVNSSPSQPGRNAIHEHEPLFKNVLFGHQKTPEQGYEWKDINIQGGIGDAVIDLSYTALRGKQSLWCGSSSGMCGCLFHTRWKFGCTIQG